MPIPASEPIADLRQRLEQLNQLEDDRTLAKKTGRFALNSEALMESLRANMPVGVLAHHDRLWARGRRSVAEVRHGVCSGCHMSLPIGLQADVQRESVLLKCETCGRFIFLAEDEQEGATVSRVTKVVQANRRSPGKK